MADWFAANAPSQSGSDWFAANAPGGSQGPGVPNPLRANPEKYTPAGLKEPEYNFFTSPTGYLRTGLDRAVGGIEHMAQPGVNPKLGGASEVIRGLGTAAVPAAIPFAVATPLVTAGRLGAGYLAQQGVENGLPLVGASPEASALAGDVAGIATGGLKKPGLTRAAARGAWREGVTPTDIPLARIKGIPLDVKAPKSLAYGMAGYEAGTHAPFVGSPTLGAVGGAAGFTYPLIKGAFQGAREHLFGAPEEPPPPPSPDRAAAVATGGAYKNTANAPEAVRQTANATATAAQQAQSTRMGWGDYSALPPDQQAAVDQAIAGAAKAVRRPPPMTTAPPVVEPPPGIPAEAPPAPSSFPEIGPNFNRPLSDFAPTIHHETSFSKAQELIPEGNAHTGVPPRLFVSNDPSLALGQGTNKGIKLEFASNGINGKVNLSKPALGESYNQGLGEFIGEAPQQQWQQNLKSVTIMPDRLNLPKADAQRLNGMMSKMVKNGWEKTVDPVTGHITFNRSPEAPPISQPLGQVASTDRETNLVNMLRANTTRKNLEIGQYFAGKNLTPEAVATMPEAEFNAHVRNVKNASGNAYEPSTGRNYHRTFEQARAEVVKAMQEMNAGPVAPPPPPQ